MIAGGVGLNSVANWKNQKENLSDVWIQPAAGDDGGALGAALLASQTLFEDPPCAEMTDVFLGPEVSDDDAGDFLQQRGIPHQHLCDESLTELVADLIASGKVVGWCRGRMEFGGAVGARSILADVTNADMKAIVNSKSSIGSISGPLLRLCLSSRFMNTLKFHQDTPAFHGESAGGASEKTGCHSSRHTRGRHRQSPDGDEGSNRLYYRLLEAVGKRTGAPVLLNTSFNVRGEPIVCTPEDMYNCFLSTGIDALIVGNCLVTEKPAEVDFERGYARSDALEAEIAGSGGTSQPAQEPPRERTRTHQQSSVSARPAGGGFEETTQKVLNFYKQLPFNFYSNAVDTAQQLARANRIKEYRTLHRYLRERGGK